MYQSYLVWSNGCQKMDQLVMDPNNQMHTGAIHSVTFQQFILVVENTSVSSDCDLYSIRGIMCQWCVEICLVKLVCLIQEMSVYGESPLKAFKKCDWFSFPVIPWIFWWCRHMEIVLKTYFQFLQQKSNHFSVLYLNQNLLFLHCS